MVAGFIREGVSQRGPDAVTGASMPLQAATIAAQAPILELLTEDSYTNLGYLIAILLSGALLFICNCLVIGVTCSSEPLRGVIGAYYISLAFADIMLSTILLPFAVFFILFPPDRGTFRSESVLYWVCKGEAYVGVALITTNICTFMWMSVDRYAALKKPARYDIEQTWTRCKCWILFSWITAILLCCPTLFTNMGRYFPDTRLCLNDWSVMPAYSATLATLVVLPPSLGVAFTYRYIFSKIARPELLEQEERTVLEQDPNILIVFVVVGVFTLSWTPWFALRFVETAVFGRELASPALHFSLLWLGLTGGAWRFVIYTSMNPEFRRQVSRFFGKCCCCCFICCRSSKPSRRYYNEVSGTDGPVIVGRSRPGRAITAITMDNNANYKGEMYL